MTERTEGTFSVASWDEDTYQELDGKGKLTRARVTFDFTGDLQARGTWDAVMCYREDGTAVFTGMQRMVGQLRGSSGSFVRPAGGRPAPPGPRAHLIGHRAAGGPAGRVGLRAARAGRRRALGVGNSYRAGRTGSAAGGRLAGGRARGRARRAVAGRARAFRATRRQGAGRADQGTRRDALDVPLVRHRRMPRRGGGLAGGASRPGAGPHLATGGSTSADAVTPRTVAPTSTMASRPTWAWVPMSSPRSASTS